MKTSKGELMGKVILGIAAGFIVGVGVTVVKVIYDLKEADGKVKVNTIDVNMPKDKINEFVVEITKLANSAITAEEKK